ncbi:MAG: ABC transporter permease subunit, partial [Chloroflexi bacterium]|nr:ABC transporter permease subunit [Chloroflexota bacterium]
MNPVLWLELRVRVRERKLWIVSLLFLLCLLVMACVSVFGMGRGFNEEAPSRVGQPLGYANAFCLLALLLILGPLAGAGRIAQEREQRTLAGLLNTPLSPAGIVWGKLAATWCFVLWLGALSLPFFVTASLWGGFSARRLLGSMAVAVIAGMTTATLAVGLSGFFNRSLTSYLTTGAVMFFWI